MSETAGKVSISLAIINILKQFEPVSNNFLQFKTIIVIIV